MLYNPRQDQVNRDILGAASIIHDGGLAKGMLWDDEGRHCINGALIVTIKGNRLFGGFTDEEHDRLWAAQQRIIAHLWLPNKGWSAPIPDWNNHPQRTKEEVVDALCGAAGVNAEVLV